MAAMKDLMDLGMKYIESDPKKLEMPYNIILIKNLSVCEESSETHPPNTHQKTLNLCFSYDINRNFLIQGS